MARWLVVALMMIPVAAGCSPPKRPDGTESAMLRAAVARVGMETRMFTTKNFTLENGHTLPELSLAYATYGRLAPDGRNAILVTHGFTSNHHAAGTYEGGDTPGFWDGLIGPGKTIDTERYFVVSSNILGSSYGSTAPRSLDPATGKPWGPDFPVITLRDIVTAQKVMLDSLGVRHLVAVAGPSYGGYQAFQWGVTFPDHMHGIVPVVTAPRGSGGEQALQNLIAQLARDPDWNGGSYYERPGAMHGTLTAMRYDTLSRYGYNEALAGAFPDQAARQAEMRRMAEGWARQFDANSLVVLRRAAVRFNTEPDFGKIRAKVLYVLSRTDSLFPPSIAPGVIDKLAAAGVEARYVEIDTEFGHSASGREWAKWAPALREFLAELGD